MCAGAVTALTRHARLCNMPSACLKRGKGWRRLLTQDLAGLLDDDLAVGQRHEDELLHGTHLPRDDGARRRILRYLACTAQRCHPLPKGCMHSRLSCSKSLDVGKQTRP